VFIGVSFLFSPRDAFGMTDGERRFSCTVHVSLFYEPRKKTAIRMLLQSSARLSCGKDQPCACAFLDESRAWVLRKSLFYECTTSACNSPLLKPFYGGLQGRFPCFAPISYHSPQKSSNIRAIYQVVSDPRYVVNRPKVRTNE
jgi:hypothetical protein